VAELLRTEKPCTGVRGTQYRILVLGFRPALLAGNPGVTRHFRTGQGRRGSYASSACLSASGLFLSVRFVRSLPLSLARNNLLTFRSRPVKPRSPGALRVSPRRDRAHQRSALQSAGGNPAGPAWHGRPCRGLTAGSFPLIPPPSPPLSRPDHCPQLRHPVAARPCGSCAREALATVMRVWVNRSVSAGSLESVGSAEIEVPAA